MKIAFLKFAGLAAGGVEKYLQSLAVIVKDEGHDVDYYYTDAAPIRGANWDHPPNDPIQEEAAKGKGINLIKIKVGYKNYDPAAPQGEVWHDSDVFEVFNQDNYDLLIIAGNGKPDYPATQFKRVRTIYSVHGDNVYDQENIVKSLLICEWQANRWLNNGGNKLKLEVVPPIVEIPSTYPTNFRERHSIPKDAFVFGLHQRNDPSIFAPQALEAFHNLECENAYYALLGGSEHHRHYVEGWESNKKDKVLFLDFTSDPSEIHSFLDALDVYAHCRKDGEVSSTSIVEAMYHSKPIVSCPGQNNGHYDQIKNCGFFCNSLEEYVNAMKTLQKDTEKYKKLAKKTLAEYNKMYSYETVRAKVVSLIDGLR